MVVRSRSTGRALYLGDVYESDLEDASRKMTLALDPYRSRSNFTWSAWLI